MLDGRLLLEAAKQSDAVLHLVRRFTSPELARQMNPRSTSRLPLVWPEEPALIEKVALATGGTVRRPDTASTASQIQEILREFGQRYLLHYTPQGVDEGGWHALTVRLARPVRHQIDARRGYFGG